MSEVTEFWLHVTDYDSDEGEPSAEAFQFPTATRFDTLGDAINATFPLKPGEFPWIKGDDLYRPESIRVIRKLKYKRGELS